MVMATVPKPKLRWVSRRNRISGFSIVSSIVMNSVRLTAAITASLMMKGEENQSSLLPSSSTACSADRPIAMVTMPAQSPSFRRPSCIFCRSSVR
ncbi:hypothetical protein ACVWW5_000687 [Bradyrhizobium sp. LM3.4]